MMNLLLVQNAVFIPSLGGANKSNRLLLEALAERGHHCRVVAPLLGRQVELTRASFHADLDKRNARILASDATGVRFEHRGVIVQAVENPGDLLPALERETLASPPDWLLVSSEDPGQTLLDAALKLMPSRVVYLARTTAALPFGNAAPVVSARQTSLLQRTTAIVAVSEYVRQYIRADTGRDCAVLPISLHGAGPFPTCGRFDAGFVTMVNPCAIKGLAIFVALAQQFPDVAFAAVPTWGTTARDVETMRQCSNIHILPADEDVDRIFEQTRILLVPSLWAEAKARVILEALVRGIPVLASRVGGNPEAMLGLDYQLPVTPIASYRNELDERMMPLPDVPPQDIAPWSRAMQDLLGSRRRYESLAAAGRSRALAYIEEHTVEPFERFLTMLVPAPGQPGVRGVPTARGPRVPALVRDLPPAARASLALRMSKRRKPF